MTPLCSRVHVAGAERVSVSSVPAAQLFYRKRHPRNRCRAGRTAGQRVKAHVRNHKLEFTRRLIAVAREAGATDPQLLGQQLAVLFEGATAMATSLNDTAPIAHARAAAAALIDAAVADRSS